MSLRRIILYIVVGIFLGFAAYTINTAPKIFHEEWLKKESAYNVEQEYFNMHLIAHLRRALSSLGVSSNSWVSCALYNRQEKITMRAFREIPANDGERIIWQLNLDQDFWQKVESRENIAAVMPRALKYFEDLNNSKIASRWANIEGFVFLNKLAAYFFENSRQAEMPAQQVNSLQRHIIIEMEKVAPELTTEALINEPQDISQVLPLSWNSTLFMGATQLVIDQHSHQLNPCDYEMIAIMQKTNSRLKKSFPVYAGLDADPYVSQWMQIASRRINRDFPPLIQPLKKKCPNFRGK